MSVAWDRAIEVHLRHEGGESRRPLADDPGGHTKYGITCRRWLAEGGDLAAFKTLTEASARAWYRARVWEPLRLDALVVERLAVALFNWAAGPLGEPRAVLCLQQALNRLRAPDALLQEDGVLGAGTRRAANTYPHPKALVMALKMEISLYLAARPHWPANRAGWLNRLDDC